MRESFKENGKAELLPYHHPLWHTHKICNLWICLFFPQFTDTVVLYLFHHSNTEEYCNQMNRSTIWQDFWISIIVTVAQNYELSKTENLLLLQFQKCLSHTNFHSPPIPLSFPLSLISLFLSHTHTHHTLIIWYAALVTVDYQAMFWSIVYKETRGLV